MRLNIVVDKHLLIWHLLYQSSVSEDIHKLKQKLWKEHKREYSLIHKDKQDILSDINNFIPDDDLIYNEVENSFIYKKVKTDTNRYRLTLLDIWGENKRRYSNAINKILKYDLDNEYTICVLHPNLDVIETDFDTNIITIGKKVVTRDKDNFLTYLFYKIIKNEFVNIKTEQREIVDVVCELATINELYTRMTKEPKYGIGKKDLRKIKEKIYPYWLMYLGYNKEDMDKLMIRDNIFFSISDLEYVPLLKEFDIYEFINYIIKNRRKILNKKEISVEDIELL